MWFGVCSLSSPCSQLNLEGNYIGAEGAKALADALRVNASLTLLDLQYNKLGDEGERILHQANTRRGKPAELKM